MKLNEHFTRLQRAGVLCHFSQSTNNHTTELIKVFSCIKTAAYKNSGVIAAVQNSHKQFKIHIHIKKLLYSVHRRVIYNAKILKLINKLLRY